MRGGGRGREGERGGRESGGVQETTDRDRQRARRSTGAGSG